MTSKTKSIIALLSMSFIGLASSATSPALATISENFPEASATAIASIATLSSLTAVPLTILSGAIVGRKVRFRTLTLIGLLIVCIGGFMPFFSTTIAEILVGRAILGIGTGLIAPIGSALTLSLFTGNDIAKQLGRNGMATNVGAIIFQMMGGYLCNYSWRMPFMAYLAVVPVLAIVFFLLPEPSKDMIGLSGKNPGRERIALKDVFTLHVIKWSLLQMVYMVCFYPFVTEMSGIVKRNGFGSATTSAYILSIFTAAGVLGGYLFYRINKRFALRTLSIGFGIGLLGYSLMMLSQSAVMVFAAASVFGIGYGLIAPTISFYLGVPLRADLRAPSMSLNHIFSSFGSFGAAFVMTFLRGIFQSTWDRFSFLVGAIFFALAAVGFLLAGKSWRHVEKEAEA